MAETVQPTPPSAWPAVLMGLVGAGVLAALWGGELLAAVFMVVRVTAGIGGGGWVLMVGQAVLAVSLMVILGALAVFRQAGWERVTYAGWSALAGAMLFTAGSHLLPVTLGLTWPYLAGVLAVLAGLAWWVSGNAVQVRVWPLAFGALAATLPMLASALYGALGSTWEVFWQGALALLAGLAWSAWLTSRAVTSSLPASLVGRGVWLAWLAWVSAALLAGAVSVTGQRWLAFISLPFTLVGTAWFSLWASPRAAFLPVTLWAAGHLAALVWFFDPAEINLLYLADTVGWVLRVLLWWVGVAGALAVSAALGGWALNRWPALRRVWRGVAGVGAVFGLTAALAAYLVWGQPGWHGDRLFIILRDQANVSAATTIPNRADRVAFVYHALTAHAVQSQAEVRQLLAALGVPYTPYYLVNALEIPGNPVLQVVFSLHPAVDRVLAHPHIRPLPELPPVSRGEASAPPAPEWNITHIGADRVWRELGVTGAGIVIGQSDSGVDGAHPALRAGFRGQWFDPWFGSTTPTDWGGHGTHTLGSIVGRNGLGVAPDAQWFGCVNLGRNLGNPALYLDCMQFMLAPFPPGGDPFTAGDPALAAHVLNNSWGCPPELEGCDAAVFLPAVQALRAAGLFVVVSAGNDGPACSSANTPPALYDEVFSVGALDRFGAVADFSSRGPITADGSGRPKPDVLAPGVDVLSAYPQNSYSRASGTSMAGPHVAGVVALMWSANPRLIGDIDRTEAILRATATPYAGPLADDCGNPLNVVGVGVVNAFAAVQAALRAR